MAEHRRERKVVTVLFADLVGFTTRAESLDPEDVDAMLRPYHERLRSELERWGGTVEKFIGDAVVAVFGAPGTREDDPERALRAALAIRDWAAEEADVEVRIAVNTGEALVSLDARPDAGEGMVAGDVVNTAARMQAAAPANGILVGEQTYRATEHVIDYRPAEDVVAKGKRDPVPVWEAREARSRFGVDVRQHGGAPLVGRTRELDVLKAALERVTQERSTQLVTLVGVPGIGKSRLVWELFQAIEQGNELVFWRQGRCLPYGDGVSFWALAEMVKAQAGILESDTAAAVEEKLARSVADVVGEQDSEWVASQVRPLVGVTPATDPGGDRRDEAFAAWRRFFESLAERRPLVLVFEDLHFADEGLLDFIDELLEWAGDVPLLAVCTARPELLDRRPGWGGGKLNSTTLALSALADEDAARLVSALLDRRLLPAEIQSALLERAGGNPLYAEQFARLYVERGSVDDVPLPETLHGLIAARLDALPNEEKELLQDAAVVGKVFWQGALRRPAAATKTLLHALERKEFVRRERRPSVEGEEEFAFRHLLVRDVAYGQIPRADRAEKHRRVAGWIESLGRPEDHAELVAYHYAAAIELARAAGREIEAFAPAAHAALRAAGDRSFALNAFASAFDYYEAALDLRLEDPPDVPGLLLARARAAHAARGEANLLVEAAEALLAVGDKARAAEAEVLLTVAEWEAGQRDRAFEHLDRALELVADAPGSSSTASVLSHAARFHMLAGRYESAIDLGSAALELAEQLGLEEVQAQALNTIGPARVRNGDHRGREELERGVAIARRIGSSELARGLVNLAATAGTLADFERAVEYHGEAERVAERMGQHFHRRYARGGRATYLFVVGRWGEAAASAEAFIAEAITSPHYLEAANRRVRADISMARGNTAAALVDAERAAQLARTARDPQALFPALETYAQILFDAGRAEEAREIIRELEKLLDEGERMAYPPWAEGILMLAELLGEKRAREIVERAPESPRLVAAVAVLEGRFVEAAEVYARGSDAVDEAFTRLRAAEKLVAEGRRAEADAQLRKALAFYQSVGATRYLAEGEALLAAIA